MTNHKSQRYVIKHAIVPHTDGIATTEREYHRLNSERDGKKVLRSRKSLFQVHDL
jgi:hypothetical protein